MPSQKEYRPDRFEEPRASVTKFPGGGTSFMGLPDKNGKHILKHSFEASKAYKHLAETEAASQIPGGQRHDSQRDFHNRIEQKRMNYNDWKRPERDASREHLTSVANPLRALNIIPQPAVEAPVHSIKTYPRNTHMGTMAHLAPGTLEPLSQAEVRAARASANRASRRSSPARQREDAGGLLGARKPPKKGMNGGEQESEGRIAEEGSEEEAYEEGSEEDCVRSQLDDEGELGKLDCSEKEALRNAALQQVAKEMVMLKEVEAQLIKEYPHGVPKITIMRVQKELGLQLPSLGFGEIQSLSDKMARASLTSRV